MLFVFALFSLEWLEVRLPTAVFRLFFLSRMAGTTGKACGLGAVSVSVSFVPFPHELFLECWIGFSCVGAPLL